MRRTAAALRLGAPLFLTTLAALVLELALTRLFSVVLFYHYAFLVISIALLGFASGGVLARALPRRLDPRSHRRLMSGLCAAACLSLIPVLHVILGTNIWLVGTWGAVQSISQLYFACMLPFALAGFVVASVMVAGARQIASLYFFDLLGASLGCLLFAPLIRGVGGPNAVLVAGALWGLAAVAWALGSESRSALGLGVLAAAVASGLVLANRDGHLLDVHFMRGAPLKQEVFSAWNSFSRISVYPDRRGEHWIEIDGGAGTWISSIDPEGPTGDAMRAHFGRTGPEVAMALRKRPKTLIIGPGGGPDVVRAVVAGSTDVTAVEINPIIANDVMRGAFLAKSHGLYNRPEVHVHVEDGRTFIQRTDERYDVIQLSQVDTWAASASGAYGLTENYLYTTEALRQYLSKLTDDGIVSVSRWEFQRPRETLRLVSVAVAALEELGIERPEDHLMLVMENMDAEGMQRMGTVLAKRTPFTPNEVGAVRQLTEGAAISLLYAPGLPGALEPFASAIRSTGRASFLASYEFDVTPVRDDRPFFFFTGRWGHAFRNLFQSDRSGDAVNTEAQFLLLALLGLSLAAAAFFLFAPLLIFGRSVVQPRRVMPHLFYCVAVGLAYIIVEVALIQKFVVFLGQPIYSLTVVIFLLLLASSVGSRVSGTLSVERLARRVQLAIAGIVVLAASDALMLSEVVRWSQAFPVAIKLAVVAGVVVPLGFLMGMPFPSGLRLVDRNAPGAIEWAWAMNSAATVLGSVLAIFLAVMLGISATLSCGVLAYGAAAWLLEPMARRNDVTVPDPLAGRYPVAVD